uniref:Uncharacterized protein n=1 Tax=Arundo donax TaxID=35708 RepID=A0A0A9CBS9_ARUDO
MITVSSLYSNCISRGSGLLKILHPQVQIMAPDCQISPEFQYRYTTKKLQSTNNQQHGVQY